VTAIWADSRVEEWMGTGICSILIAEKGDERRFCQTLKLYFRQSPPPATPTQASIPTSYPKTAVMIEKHLPAPTPQGQAEQIGTGTRAE